mgnify:CR=1 FL=1
MASIRFTGRENLTIDATDAEAIEWAARIDHDFREKGGTWVGYGDPGVLVWVAATAGSVVLMFDGPLPHEAATLALL